jgi:homoserine dehydrogenase
MGLDGIKLYYMKEKNVIGLGVMGLGVVGAELVRQVLENAVRIEKITGKKVSIEKIYVRSLTKSRTINTSGLTLTTSITDITQNPKIDIVCECMGGSGSDETIHAITDAISNGKNVIMSSKKALAGKAKTIIDASLKHHVSSKYDASVGGGIPVAKVLEHCFKGDDVIKIMGIFNATSNFIYTKMYKDNISFEDALKQAQQKGYAENDPSEDVDGIDSLNKLIILSIFGMKAIIKPNYLIPTSFTKINLRDMVYAAELGYRIKPLAMIRKHNDHYEYKIGPCLLPEDHFIASASNNFNAITIEGKNCGELGFYGQGAGDKPTATAMFDDLVNLLEHPEKKIENGIIELEENSLKEFQSNLYWRFLVKNEVGVFAKITGLLASKNVNIEKIIQKDIVDGGIEIVLLTSNISDCLASDLIDELKSHNIENKALIPFI